MNQDTYSVAAIGSVDKKSTFSGTPWHFWATARSMGMAIHPWVMNLDSLSNDRRLWNFLRLLRFQRPGGYQYSDDFTKKILKQIPTDLLGTTVISFNQHFPPADLIHRNGGRLVHYIDATFTQLLNRYGVGKQIGRQMKERTLQSEKTSFDRAEHIFTMQQWAKDSVVNDYNIRPDKVSVVLPGANIMFDSGFVASESVEEFGKERPLVLGFVGKDWRRKGLTTLIAVRDVLEKRGYPTLVRCAGYAPDELKGTKGIEFVGFIDKHNDYRAFITFLTSCDIGCLFSTAEFSSISILEFISVGRPVAGFVVDGMGDLFMPDVSIRFDPAETIEKIADGFEKYLRDVNYRSALKSQAVQRCEYVRWNRSLTEIKKHFGHD